MRTKYPRTYHLPFSPGRGKDDKVMSSLDQFIGLWLTITEKMDGSNVCMTNTDCFARSHSGPPTHESFDAFKALHSSIKFLIPEDTLVFGEWCYAKHSIHYTELPAYFLMFGIKDITNNVWTSWSGVEHWANKLGLQTVPLVKHFECTSTSELQQIIEEESEKESLCGGEREGLVVRNSLPFDDNMFSTMVGKYVTKEFQEKIGDTHWKFKKIVKNKLSVL